MKKYFIVSIVLFLYSLVSAQVDFIGHRIDPTMGDASYIRSADLDGDGDLDVLTSAFQDNKFKWYKNDGNQVFEEYDIISSIAYISRFFVVDFDADGDMDIVASVTYEDKIVWLENDGNENFTLIDIATGIDRVESIYVEDVDGDNDLDVVSVSFDDDKVTWHKNDGNQIFTSQVIASDMDGAIDVVVKDLNSDGYMDILVANKLAKTVVLFHNLMGTFFEFELINNIKVTSIAVGDLNGDDFLDLIVSSWVDDKAYVYKGYQAQLGSTGYQLKETFLINDWVRRAEIIDINGDGNNDFILGGKNNGFDDHFYWYENTDSSAFTYQSHYIGEYTGYVRSLHVADFDNDSDMDIIYCEMMGLSLWKENDGSQNFSTETISGWEVFISDACEADFDNDGLMDIISASNHYLDTAHIVWRQNLGDNTYYDSVLFGVDPISSLAVKDLDGDLDEDFLYLSNQGEYRMLTWRENVNSSNFIVHEIDTVDLYNTELSIIDLDGDNDQDIVSYNYLGDKVYWYENDGFQNFILDTFNMGAVYNLGLKLSDIDSDGDIDILSRLSGSNQVICLVNDGSQNFSLDTLAEFTEYPTGLETEDMDADGDIDFLVCVEGLEQVSIFVNDGNQNFVESVVSDSIPYAEKIQAKDINGDGEMDIVLTTRKTGADTSSTNLYYLEHIDSLSYELYPIGNKRFSSKRVIIEDMNGDGDLDISFLYGGLYLYENLSIHNYAVVNASPFVDENSNGLYDSTEVALYNAPLILSPGNFYQLSNGNELLFYIDQAGQYELNLNLDTTFWEPVDSLNRILQINPSNFQDTTLNIGVSPLNDLLIETDITDTRPRCGRTILHRLSVENLGSRLDQGLIQYDLDTLLTYNSSIPNPDSISGHSFWYTIDDLPPSHVKTIKMKVDVPISMDTVLSTMNVTTDTGSVVLLGSEDLNEIIRCSYDPNDKQVFPNYSEEGYTLANDELEYLIRFQNTGNDTAFIVEVIDTIDIGLDLNSFSLVANSHPVVVHLDTISREVRFLFENINLTDTVTNEIESQGFVKYKIRTVDSLVSDDIIENTAHIYFDGNSPITTNTTQNTVFDCADLGTSISIDFNTSSFDVSMDEPYLNKAVWTWNGDTIHTGLDGFSYQPGSNGVQELAVHLANDLCSFDTSYSVAVTGIGIGEYEGTSDIVVYPNPTTGKVGISLGAESEEVLVRILTLTGQLIAEHTFEAGESIELELNGIEGLYFLEIINEMGTIERVKVVKK